MVAATLIQRGVPLSVMQMSSWTALNASMSLYVSYLGVCSAAIPSKRQQWLSQSNSQCQGAKPALMSERESPADWGDAHRKQTRHAAASPVHCNQKCPAFKQPHAVMMCIARRTYASYADDLAQLAGSLGVQQFYVIGVSGGGPYTYAAAAYLPDRVLGVMTISTIAQAGTCQTYSCFMSAA